jgi:serine/threonine protein kinase
MALSGQVVANRYTIVREIGRGGMATVWLAEDRQHARQVAIKTLHPELPGTRCLSSSGNRCERA